jgi:hypothetical protein
MTVIGTICHININNLHNFILNLAKKVANWIKIVYNIFIQWRTMKMKVIVDEFISYLETRHAAKNTIASYERDITKFEHYFESQDKKLSREQYSYGCGYI